jgi:NAD(P)-dependent dehydrogenase (short-subunit alcohol dehydrogenase family)
VKGKNVVITGASSGIGKVTALELARLGARVHLICRDRARGEAALAEVRAAGDAELVIADLAVQSEVRAAAQALAKLDRIDVLVNNAGLILMERRLTADGIEATFAVNHLAYYLLTQLLLPQLKKAAPARIVNVASNAHFRVRGQLDLDAAVEGKNFRGFDTYCASKLANVMWSYALARRLEGSGVTCNSLHPGAIGSNWGQTDGTSWFRFIMKLGKPFLLDVNQGAATQIFLASSPEVADTSGHYFYKKRVAKSSPRSHDRDAQEALWSRSAQLTHVD